MDATALSNLRAAFTDMVYNLHLKIEQAGDATTWDGETKAQFVAGLTTLFQGSTNLTTEQVDAKVEQAISDIANLTAADVGLGLVQNFGVATQAEAEDGTTPAADKYVTVERTWQAIRKWWADETSTNPETLDTVAEFAAAIEANQDSLDTLNTLAGTKVNQTDFDTAVANLNTAIAAVVADDTTFNAGTATDKAASVKQVHDFTAAQILAGSNADAANHITMFDDVTAMIKGEAPWPAEV